MRSSPIPDMVFLLFVKDRVIIFRPTKDAYYILSDDSHGALVKARDGEGDRAAALLSCLKDIDPTFQQVEALHHRDAPDEAVRVAASIGFEDRFSDYLKSLVPSGDAKPVRWRYMAIAFWQSLRANVLIRTGRSSRLYVAASSGRSGSPPLSRQDLYAMVSSIDWVRRYVPFRFDCIVVASIYARLLHRKGLPCEMVVGVCSDPFAAHIWARSGDLVLGEKDTVTREFEPIFQSSWTL